MSIEEFIISVYLIIEELYPVIITQLLRTRGSAPAVSDAEIITMQIVGEYLALDTDKSICIYFKKNWLESCSKAREILWFQRAYRY